MSGVGLIMSLPLIIPQVHCSNFFKDQRDNFYLVTTLTPFQFFILIRGKCWKYWTLFYIFCRIDVCPIRSNSHCWYKFCRYVFIFFTTNLLLPSILYPISSYLYTIHFLTMTSISRLRHLQLSPSLVMLNFVYQIMTLPKYELIVANLCSKKKQTHLFNELCQNPTACQGRYGSSVNKIVIRFISLLEATELHFHLPGK